jgi:hypothetical protein
MQDDLLPDLSLLVHLGLKSINLSTGDNAAQAPNHHHIFYHFAA